MRDGVNCASADGGEGLLGGTYASHQNMDLSGDADSLYNLGKTVGSGSKSGYGHHHKSFKKISN